MYLGHLSFVGQEWSQYMYTHVACDRVLFVVYLGLLVLLLDSSSPCDRDRDIYG